MNCARRVLLSILSVIILGLAFIIQVINAVSSHESAIGESNNGNFIFQLVVAIFLGLVLIFALYASIWGKFCSKVILSIIFIITDVLFLIDAIVLFSLQGTMKNSIRDKWIDPQFINDILPIENEYKCCGWENQELENRTCETTTTCKETIEDYVTTYSVAYGVTMIVLFIVLTVAIIILIIEARNDKKHKNAFKDDNDNEERFMTPFAYGWNS